LQKQAYGLTSPLITLASGAKMGKTEKGAVWLNEDLLSPYDYWQFWRNTDDRDVKRFLNFFTEIDPKEIDIIFDKEKDINKLKVLLANKATSIIHGEVASKKAEQTAKDTFEGGGLGSDLPEIKIKSIKIEKGINILDLIADNNILPSKSEARRAIANKGFKINDFIIENEKKILKLKDFKNNILKLSYGKKKHYLIKII
jgi:tyrosyl-tRNA synthetase